MSKGAFCTPRSVLRSVTLRNKPASTDVIEQMKKLDEEGMGKFMGESEKEKSFHKLIPNDSEERKQLISKFTDYEEYKKKFKIEIDSKYITIAQHKRLLAKSPNKDILISEFGYKL